MRPLAEAGSVTAQVEGPLEDLGQLYDAIDASLRLERTTLADYLQQRHAALLQGLSSQLGVDAPPSLSSPCRACKTEQVHAAAPPVEVADVNFPKHLSGRSLDQRLDAEDQSVGSETHKVSGGDQSHCTISRDRRLNTPEDISSFSDRLTKELNAKDTSENRVPPEFQAFSHLQLIAVGGTWDLISGALIMLSILAMGAEMQYDGVQNAYEVNYIGFVRPAAEALPGWSEFFSVADWVIGIALSVEVFAKMAILREKFFTTPTLLRWNLLDLTTVALWIIFRAITLEGNSAMLLRCLRLTRLSRLLRVLRWIGMFDSLLLIIKSIESSASILVWFLVLLLILMMTLAMFIGNSLTSFMRDSDVDEDVRQKIYEKWGSFLRATTTMFAITLANWAPTCWELMNNVNVLWGIVFVLYKCTVGFAVVQVISSVFVQQTFKIAARDDEIMINGVMGASAASLRTMQNLFNRLDENGNGVVTKEEWEHMLQQPRVRAWFAALEVDLTEVNQLFDALDDGDGLIRQDEFIKSIKRIKGPAKSKDLIHIASDTRRLKTLMAATRRDLARLAARLEERPRPEPNFQLSL